MNEAKEYLAPLSGGVLTYGDAVKAYYDYDLPNGTVWTADYDCNGGGFLCIGYSVQRSVPALTGDYPDGVPN
jgi:hypothetical protein